jgi:hypothetical protein
MEEGTVVICGTTQAGTVVMNASGDLMVLLANGNIWFGPSNQCRLPQSEEDLAACPLEVDRFEERERR